MPAADKNLKAAVSDARATASAAPPMKSAKAKAKAKAKPEKTRPAAAASRSDTVASDTASAKARRDMAKRVAVLDEIAHGGLDDVKTAVAVVSYKTLVETMRREVGMRMTGVRAEDYARVYKAYAALTQAPKGKPALKATPCDALRCVARDANLRGFSRALKKDLVAMLAGSREALERFVETKAGTSEPEESIDGYVAEPDDEEEDSAES